MRLAQTCCTAFVVACASMLAAAAAQAQTRDKVSFGTNWVAEAEHGGFYQALIDGTYIKHGLDVMPNAPPRMAEAMYGWVLKTAMCRCTARARWAGSG